jgi:hypothetical protein
MAALGNLLPGDNRRSINSYRWFERQDPIRNGRDGERPDKSSVGDDNDRKRVGIDLLLRN